MKGWKECPDCWGTGFYKGYGAPCGKKKPVEDDDPFFATTNPFARENQAIAKILGIPNPSYQTINVGDTVSYGGMIARVIRIDRFPAGYDEADIQFPGNPVGFRVPLPSLVKIT